MHRSRRDVLAGTAGSIAVGLAGCLGDDEPEDDGDATNDDEPTTTVDSTTTSEDATGDGETTTNGGSSGATVQVRSLDEYGDVLVDADGMTLYMFDQDEQGAGASTCSGSCADNWPPVSVDGEPTVAGDVPAELSTLERDDGSTQVAANGWPLYRFAPDEKPGDATGQGVGGVWWVLDPSGRPVKPSSSGTTTGTATGTETESGGGYGY